MATSIGIAHLSTGDMLRAAMRQATPVGQRVAAVVKGGDLASDELVLELVSERLAEADCQTGCLFDGVPRNAAQATALDHLLAIHGRHVTLAVEMQVPDDELIRRINERSQDEGRDDDTPETVKHRLDVYRQDTVPILDYYREQGILRSIDGLGSEDDVYRRIAAVLPLKTGSE
jgi:adenylate kinase